MMSDEARAPIWAVVVPMMVALVCAILAFVNFRDRGHAECRERMVIGDSLECEAGQTLETGTVGYHAYAACRCPKAAPPPDHTPP